MSGAPAELALVLGMHRSGTSLCAHMLSLTGIDMSDVIAADGSNAKGHWEQPALVALHGEILRLFGRDWYDERHGFALPPGWWADPRVRRVRDRIISWLEPRLAGRGRVGFKDPRAARLLPMWHEIGERLGVGLRFVLCIREPSRVVRSLAARDELQPADSEYRWVAYNTHAVEGIGDRPAIVLPYEDWFPEPARNLSRLVRHFGLPRDPADPVLARAAQGVADPGLRHDAGDSARLLPATRQLHRLLAERAGEGPDAGLRAAASLFIGFEQLIAPVQHAAEMLSVVKRQLAERETALATARARQQELEAALLVALPPTPTSTSGTDEAP